MLFFFTGTGNSLFVARTVAEAVNEPLQQIAACRENEKISYVLEPGETIGFVFPVYFYTLPTLVVDWIDRLDLKGPEKPYVFAVLTCGAQTGGAAKILEKKLLSKRLTLDYLAAVVLPDNYVPLLKVPSEKQQASLFGQAQKDMQRISHDLSDRVHALRNDYPGAVPALWTRLASPFYKNGRPTKRFHVSDNCTHCGYCEQICPEQIIKLDKGIPVWTRATCVHCLACLHRCPAEAINYGASTAGKRRYVHPEMKRNECGLADQKQGDDSGKNCHLFQP